MKSSSLPYCAFVPGAFAIPESGVHGSEVHRLDTEGLSIVYSELLPTDLQSDRLQSAALEFHQTVHSIFAHTAVVPFRFPTFLDDSELKQHLVERATDYLDFLQNHANHVQMEIRVLPAEHAATQAGSGTEYMNKKAAERRRLLNAADKTEQIEHARTWSRREVRDAIHLFALVDRPQVNAFRDAAANLMLEDVKLRVTGPWPATEFFASFQQQPSRNVVSISRGERS